MTKMCPLTEAALRALMHQSIALGAPRDIDELVDAVKRFHHEPRHADERPEVAWLEFKKLLARFIIDYGPQVITVTDHGRQLGITFNPDDPRREVPRYDPALDMLAHARRAAPPELDEDESNLPMPPGAADMAEALRLHFGRRNAWTRKHGRQGLYMQKLGRLPRYSDVLAEVKRRGFTLPKWKVVIAEDEPVDPIPAVPPDRLVQVTQRYGKTFIPHSLRVPPGAGKTRIADDGLPKPAIDTSKSPLTAALRYSLDPANAKIMVSPAREEEGRQEARVSLRILQAKNRNLGLLLSAKDAGVALSLCGPANSALDERMQHRVEQERHVNLDNSEVRSLCDEIDYWQDCKGGIEA